MGKLKNWWTYNRPEWHTSDGWASWSIDFRKKAPIRYFFVEYLPMSKLGRFPTELKHLYHKKITLRKSNVIVTELDPGIWYDVDTQMLYACFKLLKDFVEKELLCTDSLMFEGDQAFLEKKYAKHLELYKWWTEEREAWKNDEEDQLKLKELIEIRETLWT